MQKYLSLILLIVGLFLLGTGILLAQDSQSTGIVSEIIEATIGEDATPVITFTLKDDQGEPLTMDDIESVRFLLARIDEDELSGLPRYFNYFSSEVQGSEYELDGEMLPPALETASQPTFESGDGSFTELEAGTYTYTFAGPLGDDYSERRTHVIAAEVIRSPRNVAANPMFTFVPDGDEPDDTRFIVETQSCNDCHGELSAHGGSRIEVNMCGLCHNVDNIDPETGNSLDLRVLIHRIHRGENLPSVQDGQPYLIVGRQQSIHDYSTVAFPQDVRNCIACHTGPDYEDNLEASVPTCTSCHDDVDPTISLNHPGNPKAEDSCGRCHYPELEEFDEESIPGAHVIPLYSEQIAGINLEIVSVDGTAPGQSPTVNFRVTTDAGDVIAPADMDYLAVTLAGPTTDYTNRITETVFRSSSDESNPAEPPDVEDVGDGIFSYTFTYSLPEESTGTYGFGLEGYVVEEIDDIDEQVRVAGFNPVVYMSLDGTESQPRRQIIALENCDSCHNDLSQHGTIRQNPEYCAMCHNPMASDENQRPEDALPPVSINLPLLIHKIHRGENANNPLLVYGFGGSSHDYSELRFPSDVADCVTCHLEDTYNVLPEGHDPTVITQDAEVVDVIQAARAVCTSCHDTSASDGHAEIQTTVNGVETCSVCHGPNREFDVTNAHP